MEAFAVWRKVYQISILPRIRGFVLRLLSFDFAGTYSEIVLYKLITSQLDDGRMVWVTFEATGLNRIRVIETFETEYENSLDLQRNGWQAILDNFKREAETGKENEQV